MDKVSQKGTVAANDVTLSDSKNMVRNEHEIAGMFFAHWINSGFKLTNIGSSFDLGGLKDGKLIVEKNIDI